MRKTGALLVTLALLLTVFPALAAQENQTQPGQEVAADQTASLQRDLANSRSEGVRARRELEALKKEYEAWKALNSRTVELKAASDRMASEMESVQGEIQLVRAENKKLSSWNNIYWFLAGGAVFFIGLMVGMSIAGSKRRSHHSGYRF